MRHALRLNRASKPSRVQGVPFIPDEKGTAILNVMVAPIQKAAATPTRRGLIDA